MNNPTIRWTPTKIGLMREHIAYLRRAHTEVGEDTLALLEIGLRVVDPSTEDVERVARAISVGYLYSWRLYLAEARAALKAIAEGAD